MKSKISLFVALVFATMPAFAAVTFHLAYGAPAPDSIAFDIPHDGLRYVARQPYLEASDLLSAEVPKNSATPVIALHITKGARDKINKLVASNIAALHGDLSERTVALALLVDGEPKMSIQGTVHRIEGDLIWVEVSSDADARDWAKMINDQNAK